MPASPLLRPENAVLLLVDIQEKLMAAIPDTERLIRRACLLLQACDRLEIPIVVSEQYPHGLGPTVASLSRRLPLTATVFEKMSFGCGDESNLQAFLKSLSRQQIMVCGVETHVCVNQSVHQLLRGGYQVHVMKDAVAARHTEDHEAGLAKMFQAGATPGTVEMAVFELLESAAHPSFKPIQAWIKAADQEAI